MASPLDDRFSAIIAAVTGPQGPLGVTGDGDGRVTVPALPQTLPAFFDHFLAAHADADGIVAGDERLRFGEIAAWADRVAGALAGGHGVKPGDRVAIAMRNCPSWIILYIGALKAGAIATLVNGWWTADEMADGLALTTPRLIVADVERGRRLAAIPPGATLVTLDVNLPAQAALDPLLDGIATAPLPAIAADDPATILFTSGSTGRCKGAWSTHRQVLTATYTFLTLTASLLRLITEDGDAPAFLPSALVAVPLFHVTGEVPVLLNSIAIGRKLVLMRKWDAGEALRLIEAERVTYFVGVPTMSLELLQHPDREQRDLASLADIAAGGAARPPAHVPRLKQAFPRGNPMIGYGLTETNAVGCTNYRANYVAKPNSTGRAQAPFVKLVILDDDDAELPIGEKGQVAILSAANFSGYWQDEAAARAAFTDLGYFRTGDIGFLDEDGYLRIVDRAKDIIIRGGENISCQEVEAALYAHPAIAEACVFGLPDDRLGEVPGAVVRLAEGERLEDAELIDFLATRLARFKLPQRIWWRTEPMPRLGTGKIDRRALRAAAHAALAEEHAPV
ncbi:class I adenylate-forming enzyme family protein [Sphingomonas sp. 1P06PA]|uniref:class I adenylate-forming enzyme family protein n=1 Tax=Sphingomonas sp. 1P06PA TaxID=554121 RepID=UPI0039A62C7F